MFLRSLVASRRGRFQKLPFSTVPAQLPGKVGKFKKTLNEGPGLKEFLVVGKNLPKLKLDAVPYLNRNDFSGNNRKVFFEVYGCQMNVNDTEIVWSILSKNEYTKCSTVEDADVILIVTCAIREGAETKIWNRLKHLDAIKRKRSKKKGPLQIGVLGCMAERLKTQILEKEQWVDVVSGPDSYKDLPRLLSLAKNNVSAVNVILSLDETYADVMPVRLNPNSVTAFVSIMRGCDNMCSYCIVPFTRGKERSRPVTSIESEVKLLAERGVKEVTLLGQNVNSYRDISIPSEGVTKLVPGFRTVYKLKEGGLRFAELLQRLAESAPEVRFRFTSPHPKDFPDDVLEAIKEYPNICKQLHLPAQSGNTAVLERMRRGYSREAYINLVERIRNLLPTVSLSSDFICGFCGETDEEFRDTLSLIELVKYNIAYLFSYSMREKTTAHRRFQDDVPEEVKLQRLQMMVETFRKSAALVNSQFLGQQQLILIEGQSKRSMQCLYGRNDANIKVIVPAHRIPVGKSRTEEKTMSPGDYVVASITSSNSQVLHATPLYHTSLQSFYSQTI